MRKRNLHELRSFFIYKLEGIYAIQKHLKDELPYMIDAAFTRDVKSVLEAHEHIAFKQVIRLDAIFDHLSVRPRKRSFYIIKRMIKEGKWQIKETRADPAVLDTSLIITWREIDHYKMAAYACLVGLSSSLFSNKVSASLFMAMEEEMEADTSLRELSGGCSRYVSPEGQGSMEDHPMN